MEPNLSRRQLLRSGGIVSTVVLAGCSDNMFNIQSIDTTATPSNDGQSTRSDGRSNQVPNYANYVIPTDNQSVVAYTDVDSFYDLIPEEGLAGFDDDVRLVDYPPMVRFPFGISFSLTFLAGFALAPLGPTDGGLIGNKQGDKFQTEVNELIASRASPDVSVVAKGSIVTDEIDQALRSVSEDHSFDMKMTQVDEIEGYAVYQQAERSTDTTEGTNGEYTGEIAVGETEIIVGSRESIKRVIETKQGDRLTVAEQYDPLEWALTTAGDGQMAFGGYGPEGVAFREIIGGEREFYQPEVLFDSNGFIISNTVGNDEIAAEMAAMFDSLSTQQRNKLERKFGTQANNYSMTFEGSRISASGTYDRNMISSGTS